MVQVNKIHTHTTHTINTQKSYLKQCENCAFPQRQFWKGLVTMKISDTPS